MGGGRLEDDDSDTSALSVHEVDEQASETGGLVEIVKKGGKHDLVFSKSKVYIHPTSASRDNIPGWLAIVKRGSGDLLLSWIPESRLQHHDRAKYISVEENGQASEQVDYDSLLLPDDADCDKDHSFAVPLSELYSIIVTPPTLAAWYGSLLISLTGGDSLPTLYMHDDESPSTVFSRKPPSASPPASWGGEIFITSLKKYSNVIKSTLEPKLWLINPSRQDLEVHSVVLFDDDIGVPAELRPATSHAAQQKRQAEIDERNKNRSSLLHQSMGTSTSNFEETPSMDSLTFNVLSSFSLLTRSARKTASNIATPILSHRLAKPILPHLPPPLASLATAQPSDWSRWEEQAGVDGYDSARVYLAKWARIVAQEGERARRLEYGNSLGTEEEGDLGAFEILAATYSITRPRSSRATNQPIVNTEWAAYFSSTGKLLLSEDEARRRIFQRGLTKESRKEAWLYLLGVVPWDSTADERKAILRQKAQEYEDLKKEWYARPEVATTERFIEEHHRIQIDCLRTDRTQPMFALCDDRPDNGVCEVTGILDAATIQRADKGGQPPSNHNIRQLQEILLTYNIFDKELHYVQGMSDLCSPLFITFEADKCKTFWAFVGLMERMTPNFLRDQSGMRTQLSLLQELIALMDPALYKHLEKTDSLNLFFCFRWILIAFKREFAFDDVLSIWENLWAAPSKHHHLFVALAILNCHRTVIMRYLEEFDEVLKYINELSGSMDAQSILNQADVLYTTFVNIVQSCDRKSAESATYTATQSGGAVKVEEGVLRSRKNEAGSESEKEDVKVEVPTVSDALRVLL